jgi:hypothetical protein
VSHPPPELAADPKGLGAVDGDKSIPAKKGFVMGKNYEKGFKNKNKKSITR